MQKDPAPPTKPKDPNQAPPVEEKKKPLRKEREPKVTMNSEPVVPILVKRIAKFTGVQPATREQLGAIEWHGDIYMYGGAGQKAYADLKRLQPEKNEWFNQGEIQN